MVNQSTHKALVLVATAVVALATTARAGFPTLSHNPSTGAFALTFPTSSGTLVCSGTDNGSFVTMTARLAGDATEITASVSIDNGTVLDVSTVFPVGTIAYRLGDPAAGPSGELLWTTIPAGACSTLETLPVLNAVREAFLTLQTHREWESSPSSQEWSKLGTYLVFFYAGTDFVADCKSLVTPQDDYGCDMVQGASCGPWGLCCDRHDECYATRGCTVSSWGCNCSPFSPICWVLCQAGGGSQCRQCNVEVVACFSGQPVGPSACCTDTVHPCGSPRS